MRFHLSGEKKYIMTAYTKITFFLFLFLSAVLIGCDEDNEPIEPTNGLVAVAGSDYSVIVNESIQLDGSGSHDKNKKSFSYLWSIMSKPAGSVAEISNAQVVNPSFKANVSGDYVIQLQIMQGQRSAKDQLTIHVNSNNPSNAIVLSESILEDTSLADIFVDPSKVDYIVADDIEVRADLVIAPGVVIAFEQNKGLQVISGSLQAKGTATNPISFKGTQESSAYWKGLLFYTNSEFNALEYVTIKSGGSSAYDEIGESANIALAGTDYSGATLRIANSTIIASGGYGLYLQGSSSIGDFSGNTFTHNAQAAVYLPAPQLHRLDGTNQALDNGFNGAETGGMLQGPDLTWRKDLGGLYHVTSNVLINGGLNIEQGVGLVMDEEVSLIVSATGYLKATGTSHNKIVFTSTAVNKYWNGLAFISGSPNNILDNCIISNAGRNNIADADQKGNIVVGASAFVSVKNSVIKNGNGYGIVTKNLANLNGDVLTVNNFENLSQGTTYPAVVHPDKPSLTGTWVDQWTLNHGKSTIDESLYDRESGKWFGGAADPYSASNAGFGLTISADGKFIWTTVEYFPVSECPSHTADYMTGNTMVLPNNWVTFDINYWQSMFFSSCDSTINVDTGVTPEQVVLNYEINEMYNVFTGERFWELKFHRPDNSTHSLYRK